MYDVLGGLIALLSMLIAVIASVCVYRWRKKVAFRERFQPTLTLQELNFPADVFKVGD